MESIEVHGIINSQSIRLSSDNAVSDLVIHWMIDSIWRAQRNAYDVFLNKQVVDMNNRPADRKTVNNNVKNRK